MIAVRLCGGLGNQLFQYAAARRLALKHQAELVLETSWFDKTHRATTLWNYELHRYAIEARLMTPREARWSRLYTGSLLKHLPIPRRLTLYRERHFHFDSKLLRLPDQVFLDGYWQCPQYFKDVAEIIRAEFTLLEPMRKRDKDVADLIGESNSVAVHVRRGDYVTLASAARMHGTCSLEYYREAIHLILTNVDSPSFFVFSDDPEWCRANMNIDGPAQYVSHNTADSGFLDLRLMSLCQNHIVANSSFSWWGAWLNENPTKVVIAPKRWFLTSQDTSDLIPDTWLRI